jgi:sugar fermentation stimulation protein A
VNSFCPADHIGPAYGRTLREVAAQGVEIVACRSIVSPEENRVGEWLPVLL